MGLARELAERIAVMRYEDLSDEALYWGKIALLDTEKKKGERLEAAAA